MKQAVIGNVGSVLWVVMGTIGVVMLIACTNVANLMLVRTEGRQQELAIRAALGAGRPRIAGEVLIECVLLVLIGGVAGIIQRSYDTLASKNELAICGLRWACMRRGTSL